jgi:hypothetical protein
LQSNSFLKSSVSCVDISCSSIFRLKNADAIAIFLTIPLGVNASRYAAFLSALTELRAFTHPR